MGRGCSVWEEYRLWVDKFYTMKQPHYSWWAWTLTGAHQSLHGLYYITGQQGTNTWRTTKKPDWQTSVKKLHSNCKRNIGSLIRPGRIRTWVLPNVGHLGSHLAPAQWRLCYRAAFTLLHKEKKAATYLEMNFVPMQDWTTFTISFSSLTSTGNATWKQLKKNTRLEKLTAMAGNSLSLQDLLVRNQLHLFKQTFFHSQNNLILTGKDRRPTLQDPSHCQEFPG